MRVFYSYVEQQAFKSTLHQKNILYHSTPRLRHWNDFQQVAVRGLETEAPPLFRMYIWLSVWLYGRLP
jgi:hypothetical protein